MLLATNKRILKIKWYEQTECIGHCTKYITGEENTHGNQRINNTSVMRI